MEEAEEQERLLERSRKDLEKRRKKEEALREKLRLKEVRTGSIALSGCGIDRHVCLLDGAVKVRR